MAVLSFSEMRKYKTFEERYDYLKLRGRVGEDTFGFDRYFNQKFYNSTEWRRIRDLVLIRDGGCDLGIPGREINYKPIIHHMNPMTLSDLQDGREEIVDPEYLITVTHETHNAIHYGDKSGLIVLPPERRPGDTTLWSRK